MNRKKWAAAMLVLPALHRALHALILLVCTGAAGLHGCRWDARVPLGCLILLARLHPLCMLAHSAPSVGMVSSTSQSVKICYIYAPEPVSATHTEQSSLG